jgi:hypothetical protein
MNDEMSDDEKLDEYFLGIEDLVDADIEVKRLSIRVGDLRTRVRFRFYRKPGESGIFWTQSHYIGTPSQGGPYRTSRPWGDDLRYAVNLAVTSITQYYKQAVAEGHPPSDAWLVEADDFES